jgi:hypothetical protein
MRVAGSPSEKCGQHASSNAFVVYNIESAGHFVAFEKSIASLPSLLMKIPGEKFGV